MTDIKPDSEGKEAAVNNSSEASLPKMEEKNDMFVSALESPTDSGLAGLETLDSSSNNHEDLDKTPNSDTMEDLSLQVNVIHIQRTN